MPKRAFPSLCGTCGKIEVHPIRADYVTQFKHDGTLHDLQVDGLEIPTCASCGAEWMSAEQDERIVQALRDKVGLLNPCEIKAQRKQLGLTQEQLANKIGAAKESVCRWETGALIQSVSTDRLLRMFFEYPAEPIWSNQRTEARLSVVDARGSIFDTIAESRRSTERELNAELLQVFRNSIECQLLSGLLVDDTKFSAVESWLSDKDFVDIRLRHTYQCMQQVFHDRGRLEAKTVVERLGAWRDEFPVEPHQFIASLVDSLTPQMGVEHLAELMAKQSRVRSELKAAFHATKFCDSVD